MLVSPLSPETRALAARMRRITAHFRTQFPLSPPAWTSGSYPLSTNVAGKPGVKTLVWFPSPGCTWSLAGGCTMCDFGSNPNVGSVEDALRDFSELIGKIDHRAQRIHIA